MTRRLAALALAVACILPTRFAAAAVLGTDTLITPMAPSAPKNRISLGTNLPVDPDKPVWVVYTLLAVSASEKPEGSIVIDAALELVPTPIGDSVVVFETRSMKRTDSAGTIGQQLAAQVGQRTPEQLTEAFGPELYAAYQALNEKRGSILEGRIIKTYGPVGDKGASLMASFERASGVQPMLLNVVMGQGEIPREYTASESAAESLAKDKLVAAGIGLLLVILIFWRRRKRGQ